MMPMIAGSNGWRGLAPRGIAVAALITIAVLYYRLAVAPIHGVQNLAACARAYADARTRQDTMSVDFLSYTDASGRSANQRCGVLREANVHLGRR